MLFNLHKTKHSISKTPKYTLKDFGWKESDLQTLIFENLDDIFPDDDLLLIAQSEPFQEQPDLMAIDKNGTLVIFELKAWESYTENLLQGLRYGQIFGQYDYEDLNQLYKRHFPNKRDLLSDLKEKFNNDFSAQQINTKQKFVIITNGVDFNTRKSINYWKGQGLNVNSWIYRLYKIGGEELIEFDQLRISDNPLEDIQTHSYILNTNKQGGDTDEKDMLNNSKAAAYFAPWKFKIDNFQKGDRIFLYSSGKGIIAKGIATGQTKQQEYQGDDNYPNEEYFQSLSKFTILKKPIRAAEIKVIAETNYVFMQTLFAIPEQVADKLWNHE